ncbi:MAG TPA: tetratricopeptide repeat protein, partial [Candidatus Lustribacter sp.]|nr:tetratricopeptide repeat protein [Candidatus Lustribacter sp.]
RAGGAASSSAASLLFDTPPIATDAVRWESLPRLRRDSSDPYAGWLQTVTVADAEKRIAQLAQAPGRSAEIEIETGYAGLEAGQIAEVVGAVNRMLTADPWEWRAVWMSGLAALARDDSPSAQSAFNAVYGQVPGELAPKLGLAYACERSNEVDIAESLYTTCARTDAAYVPTAAFGLARLRAGRQDIDAAASALDLVPESSRAYPAAQQEAAHLLATHSRDIADLSRAMTIVDRAAFAPRQRAQLAVTIYRNGLAAVAVEKAPSGVVIGGQQATATGLRRGLEQSLRDLAKASDNASERVALVDEANAVRPWSLR